MTGTAAPTDRQHKRPIAAWWHTLLLTVILLGIAARGAMFQAAPASAATAVHNVLPLYISLVVSEVILVYAVWRGIGGTGTTLTDLVGGRWETAGAVLKDVVRGIALWAVLSGVSAAWDRWAPLAGGVRSISPLLPHGPVEIVLWIVVSLVGGVAEEIVFRGYFHRQFEALTRNQWAALALQAALFGISHGYQGLSACIKITLIGGLFGLLALWNRSLRPGMVAHVWTDIAGGVFRI
ncbi:MAG: CPBP family intramembrane glutamic endopeptidase [Gemmatimonadota bacterium]